MPTGIPDYTNVYFLLRSMGHTYPGTFGFTMKQLTYTEALLSHPKLHSFLEIYQGETKRTDFSSLVYMAINKRLFPFRVKAILMYIGNMSGSSKD